ncbi:MAG: hypothetical protein JKX94_07580, partial [Sneathiella sp.]|nr:hypothetical protein [Sneathiella sp.]
MQTPIPMTGFKKTQPILIFGICFVLAILSWWYLTEQRQSDSKLDLAKQAEIFSRYITNDIDARLPALERMVHRWIEQGGTSKKEFVSDATQYISDIPGFQAIEWVDETYHVRWVVPLKGNEKAENLYLGFEER